MALAFLAAGCSRESAFRAVVNDQTAAMEELTEILKTVKDKETMDLAREKLVERTRAFENIAERAKSLGNPSPDVRERLLEDAEKLKRAFSAYNAERGRVQRLPGGAAFLKSLDAP